MAKQLVVTSSPHLRTRTTTRDIMLDVVIALIPSLIASVLIFGIQALLLTAICVLSCVLFEHLFCMAVGKKSTIGDYSAVVTGILLAYNLPVTLPPWMALIGGFVAIVVVKQLFGGIGQNFANPAIVARIVLMLSFGTAMSGNWVLPANSVSPEAVIGATPLALAGMEEAVVGATPGEAAGVLPAYLDMFLGRMGGSLGETCTLALLLGGVYLVCRGVITITTPCAFMGTAILFSWALGADPMFQLLSGGLVLGAVFMATDYSTTPITEKGKLIFGIGCGIITVLIRQFGSYPEGVSFAILLMNILAPHINALTRHKVFGGAY